MSRVRYYNLQKNWRKVRRHLADADLQGILVRDFNKFTYGRWRQKFTIGHYPDEFESCDWRWNCGRRGRYPAYWKFVKHAACHWLVNHSLRLAQLVEPDHAWRILTSDRHSTVWDGKRLLFDFNFQALGISASECFRTARDAELLPGEQLPLAFAAHYSADL